MKLHKVNSLEFGYELPMAILTSASGPVKFGQNQVFLSQVYHQCRSPSAAKLQNGNQGSDASQHV